MASVSFYHRFFQLAIVNVLANLLVPLAGLIDTAFLGHLSEIRYLAGVALATVLFNYIYWTFGFLRMGTTGTTAQAIGRGDRSAVLLILLRNSLMALGLGLLAIALQYPLREIGFTILSAAPEVKAAGRAYYDALIWGAPATLLNFVLIGWFLGRAQGSKVFVLSAISSGSNVALDYWFINLLNWGSAGAGAATAISQYLALALGIALLSWEGLRSPLRFNDRDRAILMRRLFDPAVLKAAFSLNSDILIRTFALVSTFALFTNLSATFGTVTLATNTVLMQVVTFAAYFIDGLAFATESFAGIFQGQRSLSQLKSLIQISGTLSLILGIAFAIAASLFPDLLFGLLTDHSPVLNQIHRYVFWLFPVLGFGSLAYMLDGYFLGLTAGRILRWSTVIAAMVGISSMAIAWQLQNDHLLWFSLTLFMAARAFTLSWYVPKSLNAKSDSL